MDAGPAEHILRPALLSRLYDMDLTLHDLGGRPFVQHYRMADGVTGPGNRAS